MAEAEAHSDPTPFDPSEVLRIVDAAIDENAEWLQSWHRSIVCGEAPEPRVVSEYAQYLSQFGRLLALKSDQGHPIPTVEYDAFTEMVQRFNGQARRIRKAQSELDPLTGLHNRQVMMTVLERERERERALRTGAACCIVLADIDRFKPVNDTYGHATGDFVLQTVAGRFLAKLRPYDEIFRYGGEDFLICLPDADANAASEIVERLRLSVADQPVPLADGTELPATVSFGICPVDAENALKQTIEHADQALYAAKHGGRNQLRVWSEGGVR